MPGLGSGGSGAGAVRAGRAYVELYATDNKLVRTLESIRGRFQSLGGLAVRTGGALGAAGALALSPLKPVLDTLQEQGKLADLAQVFNLTGEKASRLFGIMRAAGSDLRDAQEGLATFGQRIDDAIAGKGEEAVELFQKLGVSAREFKKLDTADRFYKLLDVIRALPPDVGHLNLLMKAMGEDTGKNLGRTLNLTAEEMQELGEAFQMSSEDLEKARKASFAYTIAAARIGAVWTQVVAAVAPAVKDVSAWVGKTVAPVIGLVQRNRELVVTAFAIAGGIVAAGGALVGFGLAIKTAGVAIGVTVALVKGLAVAIGLLTSPIGLAVAAVSALGYVLLTETDAGREALDELGSTFRRVGQAFSQTWTGVVDAVKAGDLELAFKIAGAGIKVAWYELLATLKGAWNDFLGDTVGALRRNPTLGRGLIEGTKSLFGPIAPLLSLAGFDPTAEEVAGALKRDVAGELAKLNAAKAELAALTTEARTKALTPPPPIAAPASSPGRAAQAALYAGSLGSYSAIAAAQQFGGGKLGERQLRVQEKIEINTAEVARSAQDLLRALSFK